MSEINYNNLIEVLAFLAGPAGTLWWMIFWGNMLRNLIANDTGKLSPIGAGLVRWLKLNQRSPEAIQVIHLIGSFLVPGLAMLIFTFVSPEVIARLEPVWAFATMLITTYLAGQVWYQFTKDSKTVEVSATTTTGPGGGATSPKSTLSLTMVDSPRSGLPT